MIFPKSSLRRRKQRLYTILFFSDEDEKPKGVKLNERALIAYVVLVFVLISAIALTVAIHTPIKYIVFPNTFTESEKKAKKIQELYQRLESFAYELEKLKLYNNLLRQALGEKVDDSISVNVSRLESMSQKTRFAFGEDIDVLQVVDIEHSKPRFIFPVYTGFVTRDFDPNIQHFGVDIAAKEGDVVRAIDDGYVIFSDWTYKDGYVIMILHSGGYISVYKHSKMNLKAKNAFVRRGEAIALIGKTGKTGNEPHLHFELWKNGKPLNPRIYISN